MWCREQPALFGSTALYALFNAVIPYITLWFTAQILNELAGTRQRGLLIQKIVALLVAESVLLLLKAAALRWNHTLSDGFCMNLYEWKRHFDKLLSMDFCDVENPQTHELLNAVQQTSHWSSFGMRMVYYQFQNFLEAVFQLIGGIALSVSLFRLPVRQEAGWLVMLNHPVCIVLVALLLAGVTALSPYLETISTKCWIECDAECTLGNRFFSFLYNLMSEPKRALDVRLYRQDIFFDQIRSIQDSYGTKSKAARYARGKAGAACAASVAVSKIFIGLIYLFVCLKAWGGAFGIGSVTQYVGAITALSGGLAKILEGRLWACRGLVI